MPKLKKKSMLDMKSKKSSKIGKVTTINDLYWKCKEGPDCEKYQQLAIASAQNLGGANNLTVDRAIDWLKTNAMETDEEGVVDEINFCIPLVK